MFLKSKDLRDSRHKIYTIVIELARNLRKNKMASSVSSRRLEEDTWTSGLHVDPGVAYRKSELGAERASPGGGPGGEELGQHSMLVVFHLWLS